MGEAIEEPIIHDKEMIDSHCKQLKKLNETVATQNEELVKGREEFSALNTKIGNIEGELVATKEDKKITNGNTQKELKSLREMITETNNNVAYLRGLKDGELQATEMNQKASSNWRDALRTGLNFIYTPIVTVIALYEVFFR